MNGLSNPADLTATEPRWPQRVVLIAICLLILSAFSAPNSMPGLAPVVEKLKLVARVVTLAGLSTLLALHWKVILTHRSVRYLLPFFLFCMWAVLSTLWSPLKAQSLWQSISLVLQVLLAFSVSIAWRDQSDTSRMIRDLILILCCLLFFLLSTAVLIPSTEHLTRGGLGFGHATSSAAAGAMTLLILVLCKFLWNWKWVNYAIVPGGLLSVAVIVLSNNRLTFALTILFLLCIISIFGSRQLIASLLLGMSVLVPLYPIVDPEFKKAQKVLEVVNRKQSSDEIGGLSGRGDLWEIIIESYKESPLIGHGYFVTSKTGEIEVWYVDEDVLEPVNWTAHNMFLQALVSTGIVGFLLFTWAILLPVYRLIQATGFSPISIFAIFIYARYFLWGILNEAIIGPIHPESVAYFVLLGIFVAHAANNGESHREQLHPL